MEQKAQMRQSEKNQQVSKRVYNWQLIYKEYWPADWNLSLFGSVNDFLKPQHAFINRAVNVFFTEGLRRWPKHRHLGSTSCNLQIKWEKWTCKTVLNTALESHLRKCRIYSMWKDDVEPAINLNWQVWVNNCAFLAEIMMLNWKWMLTASWKPCMLGVKTGYWMWGSLWIPVRTSVWSAI